jgi:hypothetical protein
MPEKTYARNGPSAVIARDAGISDYRLQITDSEFAVPTL